MNPEIDPATDDVYGHLAAFSNRYAHLLDEVVGDLLLDQCFLSHERGAEMTRWWDAVFRRAVGW